MAFNNKLLKYFAFDLITGIIYLIRNAVCHGKNSFSIFLNETRFLFYFVSSFIMTSGPEELSLKHLEVDLYYPTPFNH